MVPAIVQDAHTKTVLMLGYMNEAAYQKTIETITIRSFRKSRIHCRHRKSRYRIGCLDTIRN